METFVCHACDKEKLLCADFFYIKSDSKTGFEYNCKVCASAKKKFFREQNKEKGTAQAKSYYKRNRDKVLVRTSAYNKSNRDKSLTRHKNRVKIDPAYRLRGLVSRAVGNALKITGNSKGGSILNYLPYSMAELKQHLESQFESWMNWNNHGKYDVSSWKDNDITTWTWQIDHIIPQSDLPYSSMEDDNFKKCWALENLRPLSAKQNIIKGNRYNKA